MFKDFTRTDIKTLDAVIRVLHGGDGPPLLLLHGYPQTHVMWHKIAPRLARHFTVVATDLRGYGDSSKPNSDPKHVPYSKRAMANDQVQVMTALGYEEFHVVGHDRGARVAHRMALDHGARVQKLALLDIVPTEHLFSTLDKTVASGYYHWFFLIQDDGLPETMIGADPEFYLRHKCGQWSTGRDCFTDEAMKEYIRCFKNPETIRATCEDYRAAASVDLEHDAADMHRRIDCPVLVLWGAEGLMGRHYDVLDTWRARATDLRGEALPCGHYLAEEAPDETFAELFDFLKD
jgi:haloacetate dehalogenase